MAKKIRGKNDGTIYQRPNGSWSAQVALKGRRLSFTAKTRREAQEWIKKTASQIDQGLSYASTKITLAEYLVGWLANIKVSKQKSTWTKYEQVCRSYIIPNLGKVKIKDIRPEHIQGLYNHLLDHKIGIYTILKIHAVLRSALEQAVKLGMMMRNPVHFAKPPKVPSNEMTILSDSQVSLLLIAAKGHRWEALYHLALTTGMRQMELLGLKWTDLDWIKQTLKVERQLVRPDKNGIQFSAPKTRYGKRLITLGSKTIDILRSHYDRQHGERMAAGEKWVEHGLIFTNSLGGPIHPRNLLRNFKQLLRDGGLPTIRFHDLRHTAASLMLNAGIPVIAVSRRLGHARASITLDVYGHLIPGMQAEMADQIDDLVTPVELKTR